MTSGSDDKPGRYRTEFGASLSRKLQGARLNQPQLAEKIGASKPYVNQMLTGRRKPSPEWVDLIADTLGLGDKERVELHRAAARDSGFKIDLTKK